MKKTEEKRVDFEELREWMRVFINDNAIYRVAPWEKPIPGKGEHTTYTWQFYTRRAIFNSAFARGIGLFFWQMYKDEFIQRPFQIGGCETSGVPVACAIQAVGLELGIQVNTFAIRQNRKAYGLFNWVEGIILDDVPVLLVDDVAASQITLRNNEQLLKRNNYEMYGSYFTVINKQGKNCAGHPSNLIPGQQLRYIFNIDDFDMSWSEYVDKFHQEPPFKYSF